jgi:hypothetical protein
MSEENKKELQFDEAIEQGILDYEKNVDSFDDSYMLDELEKLIVLRVRLNNIILNMKLIILDTDAR